jgi:hypothetical protein
MIGAKKGAYDNSFDYYIVSVNPLFKAVLEMIHRLIVKKNSRVGGF